jgi:SnoaL-like protein
MSASADVVRAVAERLARLLDQDDFPAARALLDDACVYQTVRETLRGPDAIVESYRAASTWARRTFDEVRYESGVESVAGGTARVTFVDYVLKAGHGWHRYRCQQEFTVGADGLIAHIVHRELPGEREALDAFFAVCGVKR